VSGLAPLAAEDYRCPSCALAYPEITVARASEVIRGLPAAVRAAVEEISPPARRRRPSPEVWSVAEYGCHLRDVYVTYTIRLHRTRTEHRPVLEPMLNDLRARRFRYNDCDLAAVLDELDVAAAGFLSEVDHTGVDHPGVDHTGVEHILSECWERVASRRPGEVRTARWLVRQAMHEGVHHLDDIRRLGAELT
jgi:hypothetical protein